MNIVLLDIVMCEKNINDVWLSIIVTCIHNIVLNVRIIKSNGINVF